MTTDERVETTRDVASVVAAVDAVPGLSDDDRLLEVATRIIHAIARRDQQLIDVADQLTEVGVARNEQGIEDET